MLCRSMAGTATTLVEFNAARVDLVTNRDEEIGEGKTGVFNDEVLVREGLVSRSALVTLL